MHSQTLFFLFKVHNFAAAVQSSGPRGARLSSTSRNYPVRVYWRSWHLQYGHYALCPAADHHRADAQRTHAPPGEEEHLHLQAKRAEKSRIPLFSPYLEIKWKHPARPVSEIKILSELPKTGPKEWENNLALYLFSFTWFYYDTVSGYVM